MKNFILPLWFFLLTWNQLYAQYSVAQLDQDVKNAFYRSAPTKVALQEDLVALRYSPINTDRSKAAASPTNRGFWFAPPEMVMSPVEAMRRLNLPPGNQAPTYEYVTIPKGTVIFVGEVATGDWKNGKMTPDGRSTGMIQFWVPPGEREKVRFSNEPYLNLMETRYQQSRTDALRADFTAATITAKYQIKFEENTNPQHIQQQINRHGDFPGGILIEPNAQVSGQKIRRVQYLSKERCFLIDGLHRFYPMLSEDKIGQLAGLAFISADKRLAAVSQDRFSNISPYSTLAHDLAAADKILGWIAYGYNMEGFALPDSLAAPGYVNPMLTKLQRLRWWKRWQTAFDEGQLRLQGQEPRLFLEFQDVGFQVNPNNRCLESDRLNLQVSYQAFTTDPFDNVVFSQAKPEEFYPEIVAAIRHFKDNWSWYEWRFPELMQVRKIAETYGFLRYLQAEGVRIEGFEPLFHQYRHPQLIPIAYENYNNIHPESDLVKNYSEVLRSLDWIPNWLIGDKNEMRLCFMKFHAAMYARDMPALAKYRRELMTYARRFENDATLGDIARELKDNLYYYNTIGIGAQRNFAFKYRRDFPDLSRYYRDACIEYHIKAAQLEPDNFQHDLALSELYQAWGDTALASEHRKKMVAPLRTAATAGSREAMVVLGDRYYTGAQDESGRPIYSLALEQYQRAADLGYAPAFTRLANMYFEGKGVGKDVDRAFDWYLEAADAGDPTGMAALGMYYETGMGSIGADKHKALKYNKLAAERGNLDAQVTLFNWYFTGKIVDMDYKTAYYWLKRAADGGSREALDAAKWMEMRGFI